MRSRCTRESVGVAGQVIVTHPLSSVAPFLQFGAAMKEICQHIKSNVSEVLLEWENLVREQPWTAFRC
jgi:hypothetical protein